MYEKFNNTFVKIALTNVLVNLTNKIVRKNLLPENCCFYNFSGWNFCEQK